jgi:hypothetical protein
MLERAAADDIPSSRMVVAGAGFGGVGHTDEAYLPSRRSDSLSVDLCGQDLDAVHFSWRRDWSPGHSSGYDRKGSPRLFSLLFDTSRAPSRM